METPPIQPTPPPPAPSTGPISSGPVRRRDSAGWTVARIALVAGSIWLLGVARDRFTDFVRLAQVTFHFDQTRWLLGVLVAIAAGVVFGLALVLPRRGRGYRTADLLILGVVPLIYLIAAFLVIERFTKGWDFPSFVDRAIDHLQGFFSLEVTLAVSALLGIAIAAGARGRDDPAAPTAPPVY